MNDLILIPGLGSDATVWAPTIDALGGDFRCTVGDTLRDGTLEAMARRILDAAPETFALAGVSMGGMVALEIMRAEPHRVTALAIVDSSASPDTPKQAARRREGIAAVRAGIDFRTAAEASLAWLVHPRASPAIGAQIVEMSLRVGADTYARQSEAVTNRADQCPVLATITAPTLVIVGADDAMIPLDRAREMAGAIATADLAVIADCGHLPPIEKPADVAGLLRGLVSRPSA